MKLWIDGDACPGKALTAVLNLTRQASITVEVVADRHLAGVEGHGVRLTEVNHGSGQTDSVILKASEPGDVAVTRDLSLARELVVKGIRVMNDRGRIWTEKTLECRLEDADIMRAMRVGGMVSKQISKYSDDDVRLFLASLEKILLP